MNVSKAGLYINAQGATVSVVDCSPDKDGSYFRAYWMGGYYNVNKQPENAPFDEVEMDIVREASADEIIQFERENPWARKQTKTIAISLPEVSLDSFITTFLAFS